MNFLTSCILELADEYSIHLPPHTLPGTPKDGHATCTTDVTSSNPTPGPNDAFKEATIISIDKAIITLDWDDGDTTCRTVMA